MTLTRIARLTTFYFSATCGNCDEEITYGPCGTLIAQDGVPVIPIDMASQVSLHCYNCGASNFTGDIELETEGGDPQ